jgi:RNA polymerase sigma factor (TIGR02999 family)
VADRSDRSEVSLLLQRLNAGDATAFSDLVPLVYHELRYRAGRYLSTRGNGHTLQPTALVHEAFLRLVGRESAWKGSLHFHNALAEVMRQILVSHARGKAAAKRGGAAVRVEFEGIDVAAGEDAADWVGLDDALKALRAMDERRYQVVMLRYFAGLTDAQVAEKLDVSEKTVERDWATARAFLFAELERDNR